MKLKYLSICLSLIFFSQLNAQSKWLFGLNFSPDICYRQLSNHAGDAMLDDFIRMRNEREVYRISYSLGLGARYEINKKLSLESGLYFSDKGFQTTETPITTAGQPDGTDDYAFSVYHYLYLEIPIKALIKFPLNDKNSLFCSAGLGNNFYLGNYTETYLVDNGKTSNLSHNKDNSSQYNPYFVSGLISLGFEHNFNDQFSMRIEPIYRMGLSSTVDEPIHTRLSSFGLNLGLWMRY